MNIKPKVSVICLTYNHELYVRDCLEAFVSQIVSFPFEVLVFDDASTDSTPLILKEYQSKYPSIIKLTLYKENNFSKGLGYKGIFDGLSEAQGDYIAYCEGDDYWCNKYKLQKQVDFLSKNQEFIICAHETKIRNDKNPKLDGVLFTHTTVNIFLDRKKRNKYDFEDALTGNIFHISSMVFRNVSIKWPSWVNEVRALDMILFMLLAEKGDIYLMRDIMSVYRSNPESITSSNTEFSTQIKFNNASIEILERMNGFWANKYKKQINKIIARYFMSNMFCYLSKSNRNFKMSLDMFAQSIAHSFIVSCKYLLIESYIKLAKHF